MPKVCRMKKAAQKKLSGLVLKRMKDFRKKSSPSSSGGTLLGTLDKAKLHGFLKAHGIFIVKDLPMKDKKPYVITTMDAYNNHPGGLMINVSDAGLVEEWCTCLIFPRELASTILVLGELPPSSQEYNHA